MKKNCQHQSSFFLFFELLLSDPSSFILLTDLVFAPLNVLLGVSCSNNWCGSEADTQLSTPSVSVLEVVLIRVQTKNQKKHRKAQNVTQMCREIPITLALLRVDVRKLDIASGC